MSKQIAKGIYNAIFRNNITFLGAVFLGSFAFELGFDTMTDKIWDSINRGRQWKDIRHRYVEDA
ncbi:MAG: qcr9 subunit 9 of the ubiquinol cytochrome-c reductase complex [Watsoniomyces obsoletus]|nr:MAG: qcr9 subunit 9 of the ubiquinol cytochrome-c reductase complex [Watsoniomyces obsoletus]